jgi:hypothetical protein
MYDEDVPRFVLTAAPSNAKNPRNPCDCGRKLFRQACWHGRAMILLAVFRDDAESYHYIRIIHTGNSIGCGVVSVGFFSADGRMLLADKQHGENTG